MKPALPALPVLCLVSLLAAPVAAQGQPRHWCSYLGGTTRNEEVSAVTADANGDILIAGHTEASNFPATAGAFQTTPAGARDVFVARLSADGSQLLASTRLGGSARDSASWIHVDASGSIWVGGSTESPNFPVTPNALKGGPQFRSDAFVARLSSNLASLEYSTCFGSDASGETGAAFALDPTGPVLYLAGTAGGQGFAAPPPTTANALRRTLAANSVDAYFAALDLSDPLQTTLYYATLIGGSGIEVSLDSLSLHFQPPVGSGTPVAPIVALSGTTFSTDFPLTPTAFQATNTSPTSVGTGFVAVFDPEGTGAQSLLYSSYFGGSGADQSLAHLVDQTGALHLVLASASTDLPLTPNAMITAAVNSTEVFYAQLDPTRPNAAGLRYGSWVVAGGGSQGGNIRSGLTATPKGLAVFVTSLSGFPRPPSTPGAFQALNAANGEGYAFTLDLVSGPDPVIDYATAYHGCSAALSARAVALHPSGDLLLVGHASLAPATAGVMQEQPVDPTDGFVGRLQTSAWSAFRSFGTSCASSVGLPTFAVVAPAHLCGTMRAQATSLAPSRPGVVNLGFEIAPIPLGVIGAPSCVLAVHPLVGVGVSSDATGVATYNLSIPNLPPVVLGLELPMQYIALDAGANAAGIVTTNGAAAVLRW